MEAAAYCWALFHRKNLNYPTGCFMYDKFYNQYKDCICQSMYEVIDCLKDGIKFPQRYFDFSASKIRAWNKIIIKNLWLILLIKRRLQTIGIMKPVSKSSS